MTLAASPTMAPAPFMGFVTPDRSPDIHYPSPDKQEPWLTNEGLLPKNAATSTAIWLPTAAEPGLIVCRQHEDVYRPRDRDLYADLSRIKDAGALGLQLVLEAVGLHIAAYTSPTDPKAKTLEMTIPWPEAFCEDTDVAVETGLTHVQFATSAPAKVFRSPQLIRSLRRGRMLLSSLDPTESDDWQKERQFTLYWHDLTYHAIGHLGLSQEVAGHMFERAKPRWWRPFSNGGRASELTGDIDNRIHVRSLLSAMRKPNAAQDVFRGFCPKGHDSAARLVATHMHSLAARTASN
jgi:hypothetical protein